MCTQIGIRVHASLPTGATLQDWYGMRKASHSFVVDKTLFPRLFSALKLLGQEIHEVPIPIGWEACRKSFLHIATICGRREEAELLLGQITQQVQQKHVYYQKIFSQKKVALVTRMRNSYRIDSISRHGLGIYDAFVELGMDITILIQGARDQKIQESYRTQLQEKGIDAPFLVFDSPFSLTALLQKERFDMICVNDQGRICAEEARTPHIDPSVVGGGFYSLFRNWNDIERCLLGGH